MSQKIRYLTLLCTMMLASGTVHAAKSPVDGHPPPEGITSERTVAQRLAEAKSWLKQRQNEKARPLLETLAEEGNAEASYLLTYHFNLAPNEQLRYLEAAARQGHTDALKFYIETAFYRAGLDAVEPKKILSVYREAKAVNPRASFYNERRTVEVLKMASEVPPLNTDDFLRQYQLDPKTLERQPYSIWALAEEASVGGRFGAPDPTLTMQLILREGPAPAELTIAVESYYPHWKNGEAAPFNLCDHITSGVGMSVCAHRAAAKAEENRNKRINALIDGLDDGQKNAVISAFEKMSAFAASRASNEEGHGGTMRNASIIASTTTQQNNFVKLIQEIRSGSLPPINQSLADTDKALNTAYQSVMQRIRAAPQDAENWGISTEGVRDTQRRWIKYRDAAATAMTAIHPDVTADQWQSYFTAQRSAQLDKILAP